MPPREARTIDLGTLDPRELADLRDNVEADVQNLTQSAVALQRAAGEFGKSGQAIERLAEQKEGKMCETTGRAQAERVPNVSTTSFAAAGQPMLVPVTSSLYVKGMVANPDRVLVDIGTSYFIEVRFHWQWRLYQARKFLMPC